MRSFLLKLRNDVNLSIVLVNYNPSGLQFTDTAIKLLHGKYIVVVFLTQTYNLFYLHKFTFASTKTKIFFHLLEYVSHSICFLSFLNYLSLFVVFVA